MRVLVTGGAGFIGSHLVEALLARGNEVWAVDDLSTGSLDNLKSAFGPPALPLRRRLGHGSCRRGGLVARVDEVYHLAAAVGVKFVLDNPLRSLLTNIRGTEVVLEAANEAGNKKVVLFSSSEVYGKGASCPFREDDDRLLGPTSVCAGPTRPARRWTSSWPWATTTSAASRWSSCAASTPAARARARLRHGDPALRRARAADEPILVYGDGLQTRCFSSVSDVVRGVLMLADEPRAYGEVFNIGTDGGGLGRRPGAPDQGADRSTRSSSSSHTRTVYGSPLRGHAAPRARPGEDPRARRLRAAGHARRTPARDDRARALAASSSPGGSRARALTHPRSQS